jgi:hypothetical protein
VAPVIAISGQRDEFHWPVKVNNANDPIAGNDNGRNIVSRISSANLRRVKRQGGNALARLLTRRAADSLKRVVHFCDGTSRER